MHPDEASSVAETLYRHGLTAYPHSIDELTIDDADESVIARVRRLQRAPRPSQIEKTRAVHPDRVQLYVLPSITPSVIRLGLQYPCTAFIGWADADLLWNGQRRSLRGAPLKPGVQGRRPWVRWAVMRALLAPVPPLNQVRLAEAIGATQPSVSNALRSLGEQVARADGGWVATDPDVLWDSFVDDYPGVGVVRTHWLSLDPPLEQARTVVAAVANERPEARLLLSGDAGADMIAGWRVPTQAVVYSDFAINPEPLGFAASRSHESTLDFVMPHDPTIWHTAKLFSIEQVADPLIVASELALNHGVEVGEAMQLLKHRSLKVLRDARQ